MKQRLNWETGRMVDVYELSDVHAAALAFFNASGNETEPLEGLAGIRYLVLRKTIESFERDRRWKEPAPGELVFVVRRTHGPTLYVFRLNGLPCWIQLEDSIVIPVGGQIEVLRNGHIFLRTPANPRERARFVGFNTSPRTPIEPETAQLFPCSKCGELTQVHDGIGGDRCGDCLRLEEKQR